MAIWPLEQWISKADHGLHRSTWAADPPERLKQEDGWQHRDSMIADEPSSKIVIATFWRRAVKMAFKEEGLLDLGLKRALERLGGSVAVASRLR